MPTVILLLGGECTGKTALAHAMQATTTGRTVTVVPEVLRAFTARNGRPPAQHEQHGIWLEQTRLLDQAIDGSPTDGVVVCDPAPVMTAVYSVQYFRDESLLPQALAEVDRHAIVAWCAPDIPWQADGVHRDGPEVRDRTHQLLADLVVPRLSAGQVISVTGALDDRLASLRARLS